MKYFCLSLAFIHYDLMLKLVYELFYFSEFTSIACALLIPLMFGEKDQLYVMDKVILYTVLVYFVCRNEELFSQPQSVIKPLSNGGLLDVSLDKSYNAQRSCGKTSLV